MSTTIEDVCVRVIRLTIPGCKPILLYKTSKDVRYSEPFPLEEDEEMSTVAMVKDDRLKHLLRRVGMQVTDERRLPPTPSIFEKLWVPSNNMQDVEARRRRQGLRYIEPLLKWPCCSCNHTIVVLGDSSESDDEELLLWPIDNVNLIFENAEITRQNNSPSTSSQDIFARPYDSPLETIVNSIVLEQWVECGMFPSHWTNFEDELLIDSRPRVECGRFPSRRRIVLR
uniref:Uncharacterized protein n=1 Tax=Ananas comosus var. bracteatus TaxID=296719 RepID=A0A6V7NXJ5_ANACO|nr:unnamed protein product [Ananas comosus var. bracteatus]